MKAYGQFCPLAQAAQLLCERWTLLIVRELIAGSTHFNELHKGVPLMSPTLLSTRLKQLVRDGVIERHGSGKNSSYSLTEAGRELRPIVELMGAWGHRWATSKLHEEDLDASLLMWDMRRSIDPSAFPSRRIVVQFIYPDAPQGARQWWLVSEGEDIDLCLDDPHYDVDLVVRAPLAQMTAVWTCQKSLNEAVKKREIEVLGDPELKKNMQDWLRSSALSRLGTIKAFPEIQWDS